MIFTLEVDKHLTELTEKFSKFGEKDIKKALHKTSRDMGVQIKRTLSREIAKDVSLKLSTVRRAISVGPTVSLGHNHVVTTVIARGEPISFKEMGAKQFTYGVRVKAFGKTQVFRHAFIFAGSPRSRTEAASGHVVERTGRKSIKSGRRNAFGRMPNEPSIPTQFVSEKNQNKAKAVIAVYGPKRFEHHISLISDVFRNR
ncbi:MAG: hypothetical protein AAGJ34_12900 [Pseudomonadota bacterium]